MPNLSPSNIGKALNEKLASEFGKEPKNGGEKRLTNTQKNKYINGFYAGVNYLKKWSKLLVEDIEEREGLVRTGIKVKNNGQSTVTYERLKKVAGRKSLPQKTEAQIREELKAELMEEIKKEMGLS